MSTNISVYRPEEFERDFADERDDLLPNLSMRPAPQPEWMRRDDIEGTGCQFIDSTYLLLDWLECPAHLRSLVVCVSGLSGGDYRGFTEITQARIGKRLGVGVDKVRSLLDELAEWEWRNDRTLVQIEEQERDPENHKFNTTRYRPIIVYYAAEFVRRIKAKGLRPVHRQQAIKEHTERIIDDMRRELAEEMPTAPPLKNRQGKVATPPQQRFSFIEGLEIQVTRSAAKWRDTVRSQPGYYSKSDPEVYQQHVEEFLGRIRATLLE